MRQSLPGPGNQQIYLFIFDKIFNWIKNSLMQPWYPAILSDIGPV